MSSLTGLIAGGGGGSLVDGAVTLQGNFTSNTTITCPSDKYIRVICLSQIIFQSNSSYNITYTLSFGSRTIISNKIMEDSTPNFFSSGITRVGIGSTTSGTQALINLTGKKNENLIISGVTRTGTPQFTLAYQIMEDA